MGPLKNLPAGPVRRSLTFSVFDALLWAVMFGLAENFITPFILLFGATVFQVSFLQGTAQLASGLGQLTGGALGHRGGPRKRLVLSVVIAHAVSWLAIYWATVLTGQVWVAIGLYCLQLYVANLAGPAWTSWMNDLVPPDQRGRFWSFRTSAAGLAQLVPIAAAGWALDLSKPGHGEIGVFGVLMFLAFGARLAGAFCIGGQYEPPVARAPEDTPVTFRRFLADLRTSNFGRFVLFTVLFNFTLQMLYPLVQVYLLQDLGLDYNRYTWITMTFTVATFVFMLYWGPLSDRFGNRRILMATALLLPLVALGWAFARDFWWLVALQLVGGFLVSGVNLTTTNFLFDSVHPARLAKTVSYFTALNTAFGFLGALSGGALADGLRAGQWQLGPLGPLPTVFLVIAVLRALVLVGFARGFSEVRATEPSPGLGYFYLTKPWQDATSWVGALRRRGRGE